MPIDVIGNKRENESWKRDRGNMAELGRKVIPVKASTFEPTKL